MLRGCSGVAPELVWHWSGIGPGLLAGLLAGLLWGWSGVGPGFVRNWSGIDSGLVRGWSGDWSGMGEWVGGWMMVVVVGFVVVVEGEVVCMVVVVVCMYMAISMIKRCKSVSWGTHRGNPKGLTNPRAMTLAGKC